MKITEVRTRVVQWEGQTVPLPPHFCTNPMDLVAFREASMGNFAFHGWVLVEIFTDSGHIGLGNAALSPIVTKTLIDTYLKPLLIGADPWDTEYLWQQMYRRTMAFGRKGVAMTAISAVDIALWDLRCRRANLPLYKLAGGAQRSVALYTTEGGWLHMDTAVLVEDAVAAKERGFGGSKLKVGRRPHEDVVRIAAVREAVGYDFEIFTDANQAFTVDEALRRARLYEPLDIGWFEEPLPADDVDGHVRLSNATTIPVAVGESIYSASHFREYLQRRACSIIQVDVARIGGITPWLKVAHMAECFNIAVAPHFLMELHASLCAAVPNAHWVEYIPQLDPITTQAMKIEGGRAVPSDEPGIGIA